jgi:hypothetical protein
METMRTQHDANETDALRRRVIATVCDNWNENASHVASDAILDTLLDETMEVRELLAPLFGCSDYWLEQMARECFSLPTDDSDGDWQALLEQIDGTKGRTV